MNEEATLYDDIEYFRVLLQKNLKIPDSMGNSVSPKKSKIIEIPITKKCKLD